MNKITILLIVLFTGIILVAGCTNPLPPGTGVPKTPTPAGSAAVTPSSTTGILEPLQNLTSSPAYPAEVSFTTMATTRIASDNPYLEYLNIRKRTFNDPLPDCLMGDAFPFTKNGTGYGILQTVPKLSAVSEDEYWSFLRKYTNGDAENTPLKIISVCQGSATAEPTWNFVEVRVVLNPTNFHPTNYTITENVLSNGKIVAQFPTTTRLVIDEQEVLTNYIPVRTDEVDLIDSVVVTYTRL
jgi:hypothetical protein